MDQIGEQCDRMREQKNEQLPDRGKAENEQAERDRLDALPRADDRTIDETVRVALTAVAVPVMRIAVGVLVIAMPVRVLVMVMPMHVLLIVMPMHVLVIIVSVIVLRRSGRRIRCTIPRTGP